MSDIHIERSPRSLVSEQMKLLRKPTPLTEAEKSEFRTRAKRISALLQKRRHEHARKTLYVFSIGAILAVLTSLAVYQKPRFVHADRPRPYVLFDRTSGKLCWSGPVNDFQAFMKGSPTTEGLPRKPKDLPACKVLNR